MKKQYISPKIIILRNALETEEDNNEYFDCSEL